MKSLKIVGVLGCLWLVGCSSPAPQEISDMGHAMMAKNEAWLELCVEAGMLPTEIAGQGKFLIQKERQRVVHYPTKVEMYKQQMKATQTASESACALVAADIHSEYLATQKNNRGGGTFQQSPHGKVTNCSTVYGWTSCHSY